MERASTQWMRITDAPTVCSTAKMRPVSSSPSGGAW
jgi:hypothetical protein